MVLVVVKLIASQLEFHPTLLQVAEGVWESAGEEVHAQVQVLQLG